ncbi:MULTISPECIES: GNAT family N-acetyltransferase [unclassified Corynebacterium]|uniref:GNAT family N-acetyltransferase n=1 Tax=unclassified Corynebacterium TaxID=2624378 RepID=UPI0029C9E3F1|nr:MULTISPECIES: GNAT family N-acetyltransferase [unclassified Corynebacterium]WPF66544.1 GNAT family N-acetyltransferase [Corynebacterium sp. 22KM0430]WPF69033.1 GNAT family N-acetyltransferase [Corynebacterium sp. 21KM1197]
MILKTERLLLRPWAESDSADLFCYASDLRVGPSAGWPVHESEQDSKDSISGVLSTPETYAMVLWESNAAIGSIGLKMGDSTQLTQRSDECELGYWVGVPYWGRGFVMEAARELLRHAFGNLGMNAVWCSSAEQNVQSQRVQEKLGFSFHHTREDVLVPLLGEYRNIRVTKLERPGAACG